MRWPSAFKFFRFNLYPLLKCPPSPRILLHHHQPIPLLFQISFQPFHNLPLKLILTKDKEVQKVTPKPETKRSQTSLWTRRRRLLYNSGTSRKSPQSRKINNLKVPVNIKIWKDVETLKIFLKCKIADRDAIRLGCTSDMKHY